MTVNEIAEYIRAELIGDGGVIISNVAKIEEAGEGHISFIGSPKYVKYLETTSASAVIVAKKFDTTPYSQTKNSPVFLKASDPYLAFLHVLRLFNPPADIAPPGVHTTALIPASVGIGPDVRIGAYVVLGEDVTIGTGTAIGPGTVIGDRATVGEKTLLYPNITIREGCKVGSRVIIHSGTVIGSDGFGFVPRGDGSYEKMPQAGIVVIEDDVEIGSNCSIDRATLGETRICKGAKLDNLIQIAHNVIVGEHTVIAAQSGIAGSTKIGGGCIIAGQVGIIGHIEIADKVTIAAQSGISKSILKSGTTYFGYPAKEHGRALRIEGVLRQLPEIYNEFNELKKRVDALTKENEKQTHRRG
jgi:UDP-3-O-[3-hydroxymyristoyl] glucosamine N-acyltransferase